MLRGRPQGHSSTKKSRKEAQSNETPHVSARELRRCIQHLRAQNLASKRDGEKIHADALAKLKAEFAMTLKQRNIVNRAILKQKDMKMKELKGKLAVIERDVKASLKKSVSKIVKCCNSKMKVQTMKMNAIIKEKVEAANAKTDYLVRVVCGANERISKLKKQYEDTIERKRKAAEGEQRALIKQLEVSKTRLKASRAELATSNEVSSTLSAKVKTLSDVNENLLAEKERAIRSLTMTKEKLERANDIIREKEVELDRLRATKIEFEKMKVELENQRQRKRKRQNRPPDVEANHVTDSKKSSASVAMPGNLSPVSDALSKSDYKFKFSVPSGKRVGDTIDFKYKGTKYSFALTETAIRTGAAVVQIKES